MITKTRLTMMGVLFLLGSLTTASVTGAAVHRAGLSPTAPATLTVDVGYGQQGGAALMYTPRWIDAYVGDKVTWRSVDALEPHTVSFGSKALLATILKQAFTPVPQKNGPPMMVISPQVGLPTMSPTYDGAGYANSGVLTKGKTWSLTFSAPGTYRYICMIHGDVMAGYVVVHARPTTSTMYMVQAGDGPAAHNDTMNQSTYDGFFPKHLTIHVGDTVTWVGGFHTITFGPDALRTQLEKTFIMAVPQQNGPPVVMLNPKAASPSGGNTYDGTGFVNSGVLALTVTPGSHAPPMFHLTFTKAGTYEYDCVVHPHMEGYITVLPAGQ